LERIMKRSILLIIPVLLFFFVCAKVDKGMATDSNLSAAPDFTITDLNGNDLSSSDYEGMVIIVNFWATWCSPCRAEIPGFIEVYEEYKDEGMQIIGISVDEFGVDKVRDFVKKYEITYPVAMYTNQIVRDFELGRAIPETIIIDKNGYIRHKHIGYMDKETLTNYFLQLAEEK